MGSFQDRGKQFQLNQYQKKIVGLIVFPSLIIFIAFTIFIGYFPKEAFKYWLTESIPPTIQFLNDYQSFIIAGIWFLFVLYFLWAYYLSRNLVGAFERVLREMDDILNGKKKTPIVARENDDLANKLLDRTNVFIKSYLKEHDQKS